MNREQRLDAIQRAATAHGNAIQHLLIASLALRSVVFSVAKIAGIKRDDLHAACTTFAEGVVRGSPDATQTVAEFTAELNRLLAEYEALTKAAA